VASRTRSAGSCCARSSADASDAASKQAFLMLRTSIGLRLDEAKAGQVVPVLTVPVGRG
jgi:hypothetical protein